MAKSATKNKAKPTVNDATQGTARRPMAHNTATIGAASRDSLPLGFSSIWTLLSFLLLCVLLLAAPLLLSGFWPVTYDYSGQALLSGLSACACLMLALHPRASATETSGEAQKLSLRGHSPIAWCLGGFLAWFLVSAATSVYLHDSLLELARIASAMAWFFIARKVLRNTAYSIAGSDERTSSREERAQLLRRLALLASIACGIGYVCWLAIENYRQTKYASQFGTFFNSNLFATYCAMSLPLALGLTIETWRALKPKSGAPLDNTRSRIGETETSARTPNAARIAAVALAGLLPVSVLLGLLVSSSKGGFLAAVCALAVWALAVSRARTTMLRAVWRRHRVVLALGALLFAGGAGVVASKTVVPRLMAMRSRDNNSTMFRAYTWAATRRMMQQRPVLGWGPGAFTSAYSRFAETGPTLSAHQLWLQIGAESGLPALLLLLGACLCGVWRGWRGLRGAAWPSIAAALGAIVAFGIHGLTDAGWSMTSVVLLLMIALALLDTQTSQSAIISREMPPHEYLYDTHSDASATNASAANASARQVNVSRRNANASGAAQTANLRTANGMARRGTSLHLGWLGATLVFALVAWAQQRAIQAEDLHRETFRLAKSGEGTLALQRAREAVSSDPLSARMQLLLAQAISATGQDAEAAHERVTQLQPASAGPWRSWANYRVARAAAPLPNDALISTHVAPLSPIPLWNRALELDPNDPKTLLARGNWLLDHGTPKEVALGWRDLERIANLAEGPFGRYAAVSNIVDLNFARAYARLAERALKKDDAKSAKALIERGLADVARARENEATNKEIAESAADVIGERESEPIEPVENDLKELQSQLG